MLLVLKMAGALIFILGTVAVIVNKIRADPPFTIMERGEEIDEEAKERIKKMVEEMKED